MQEKTRDLARDFHLHRAEKKQYLRYRKYPEIVRYAKSSPNIV